MSDSWKSCENCEDQRCYKLMQISGLPAEVACIDWRPIRCRCGGALSTVRFDKDGRPYRHCYACHVEVKLDGTRYSEGEIQKIIAGEGREID